MLPIARLDNVRSGDRQTSLLGPSFDALLLASPATTVGKEFYTIQMYYMTCGRALVIMSILAKGRATRRDLAILGSARWRRRGVKPLQAP
jgi:hypothetical protein